MNTSKNKLFGENLEVINIGLPSFADTLRKQNIPVAHVDWRPAAFGDNELANLLETVKKQNSNLLGKANEKAVRNILDAQPVLVGIAPHAKDVVPKFEDNMILHAGPPVKWENMCGAMRGGIIGGILFEKLADSPENAEKLAASGNIIFEPCHHHDAVGPMAGILTPSMPVWIIENKTTGDRAFCSLNEGLGKVLRYGAYSAEVLVRLRWMRDVLAPVLNQALELHGEINLRSLIAQALQMGDEGHNRNRAGTSLFIRELAPYLVKCKVDSDELSKIFIFLHNNDHFFLNLTMPAAKSSTMSANNIEGSSLIPVMARNGTEFGIQISGLGNQWFTGPASVVDGLYLPGFSADDAGLDIGDSVITETSGIGGFAMAAAPAIVQFVGGTPDDALETTRRMYEITFGEHPAYQIPALGFRGTPVGIDLLKIIETGILPAINTGIAHKNPGIGMVGAGLVKPPRECFIKAFKAFVKKYG